MNYYFDINNSDHKDLIPDGNVNPDNATQEIAEQAERDIIDLYAVKRDGFYNVYLSVWDKESLDETKDHVSEFLDEHFRPAVGEQIAWKLLQRQENPLYSSHKLGDESISYNKQRLESEYPPNIERHLNRYDVRPTL